MSAPPPLPDGFAVGHWTDPEGCTGCTVVIAPTGVVYFDRERALADLGLAPEAGSP